MPDKHNAANNKLFTKRRAWLIGIGLVVMLLAALGFYLRSSWLSGKMQYQLGMYYYNKAKNTHYWGGALETNIDELKIAANYFKQADNKGYHTRNGYLTMVEFYFGTTNYKQAAAAYTGLLKLYPDSSDYYFYRGNSRLSMKDYHGALQDYNNALKPGNNLSDRKDTYYMRGAIKYLLNPKDTTSAEADRKIAAKLNTIGTNLLYYKTYWESNDH